MPSQISTEAYRQLPSFHLGFYESLDSKEEKGDGQRVFYILNRKQKHKEDDGSGARAKASVSFRWHREVSEVDRHKPSSSLRQAGSLCFTGIANSLSPIGNLHSLFRTLKLTALKDQGRFNTEDTLALEKLDSIKSPEFSHCKFLFLSFIFEILI